MGFFNSLYRNLQFAGASKDASLEGEIVNVRVRQQALEPTKTEKKTMKRLIMSPTIILLSQPLPNAVGFDLMHQIVHTSIYYLA